MGEPDQVLMEDDLAQEEVGGELGQWVGGDLHLLGEVGLQDVD